ncbi:MAG: 4-amino-4-deoxychorismate lyase [Crocinitomicaceae bacterium]|jgi:branched-subunit amino acid aminotransferase/4-amino-4-deoxychorismate lyase|nr:4-amino-4-deoxychorismate lyase [Crocinitomicaceae bacterium]MBT5402074.1 4-amino-4-deoxychorismate lyase [Crocinitomicaceae bacterium]MBT6029177.1 4-amino-4-deoxychorismate lyase [Crocinitomicaceae bacterium]MBT6515272.1 4-amino-4-deoxychorismate lyase [Crocinitomicaceae bacterium]MDG2330183.1 aminotransferase class IV [Flavobacteriales bacterium]
MACVCLNGEFLDASIPYLDSTNRSFRYGDGLFESIRLVNGKAFNLENHYKRIIEGLKVLKIQMPLSLTLDKLNELIEMLVNSNAISLGGKIRLSIYRSGAGTYMPTQMTGHYLIEAEEMASNYFKLNETGLNVDIYDDVKKPVNALAPYKTANALFYIMAGVNARENGLDDALIVNENHAIIEATASNIFIVSNGVLYTPAIEDGCVGGTFRMHLINLAISENIKVYECSLAPQNLFAAEEIFLTNAIQGIQWVSSYKTKRYYCDIAKKLVDMVNARINIEREDQDEINSIRDFQES